MNGNIDMAYEDLVRTRAYALWEQEGRPCGREVEHWRASEEAAMRELSETELALISAAAQMAQPAEAPVAAKPKLKSAARKKASVKRVASHPMEHASL